jgi:hypothetical protein
MMQTDWRLRQCVYEWLQHEEPLYKAELENAHMQFQRMAERVFRNYQEDAELLESNKKTGGESND